MSRLNLSPCIVIRTFFTSLLFVVHSFFSSLALAQIVEISSSFNPVGSGARALGMGGAFIAVADDATAASWNPGGLIQLERPEVSIVGSFLHRSEDLSLGMHPEGSGLQKISEIDINYLSVAYPFNLWGLNMIVSLNHQNLYDLTREWRFPLHSEDAIQILDETVDSRQKGSLSALGLAYCIQATRRLSFGVTFNIWKNILGENQWENELIQQASGTSLGNPFFFDWHSNEKYSFKGYNFNLGMLLILNNNLTLGAVFKTPFTADLEYEYAYRYYVTYEGTTTFYPYSLYEDRKLRMPMSYGIGFAYRFSDEFTASLDIYRTEWGDFELRDPRGNKTSPITGKSINESGIDATHQIRLGAEYLIIKPKFVIPARVGFFYDPAPSEGDPDDYFGFSVGTGIVHGPVVFDIAYQYRFGNDVGSSIMQNLAFSQDVQEHTVYASLIFHLN